MIHTLQALEVVRSFDLLEYVLSKNPQVSASTGSFEFIKTSSKDPLGAPNRPDSIGNDFTS